MANTMRWRYGDTNPVMLPVDEATVVEIGDLVYLDNGVAQPAVSQADQGSESLNQQVFHDTFVGVAMQCSADGDSGSLRIATSGVFEFDCATAAHELGDLLGPVENTAGTALESQKVGPASDASHAIGRCSKQTDAATSRVLVDIVSTVMKGGVQAAA